MDHLLTWWILSLLSRFFQGPFSWRMLLRLLIITQLLSEAIGWTFLAPQIELLLDGSLHKYQELLNSLFVVLSTPPKLPTVIVMPRLSPF
jgi:hypothetical protein